MIRLESIYLDNLCETYDTVSNYRHKFILEDLFYLCTNTSFLKDVRDARLQIINKLKELGIVNPILPTDQIEEVSKFIKKIYKTGNWRWYRDIINSIVESHSFYGQNFADDYIMSKKELLKDFVSLNILEKIIFLNDPVWNKDDDFSCAPFRPRAGRLSIDYDANGPYIKAQFDIGTEERTMRRIIEKDIDGISKIREEKFRIPNLRRETDDNLSLKNDVMKLHKSGLNATQISIKIDEKFGGENSQDKIKKIIKRVTEKSKRFNKKEGH